MISEQILITPDTEIFSLHSPSLPSIHPSPMTSESIMEYVLYHLEHRVVVDCQCKYALNPESDLLRHFRNFHQSIDLTVRKEIVTYCQTLDLLSPSHVVSPDPNGGPIEGLEIFADGWKCIYTGCSGFLSAADNSESIEKHCRTHGWKTGKPPIWTKCAMQTFFKGSNTKFFEVNLGMHGRIGLEGLIDSVLDEANKRDTEWRLSLGHVTESNVVTKSPWLSRTGWERKFLGKDMKTLVQLTERPKEDEEGLSEIWLSVSRVIKACWKGADDISDRGWDLILFWLNSSDRSKADSKPFRLEKREQTVDRFLML